MVSEKRLRALERREKARREAILRGDTFAGQKASTWRRKARGK